MCYHQILATIKNHFKIKSISTTRREEAEETSDDVKESLNTQEFHSILSATEHRRNGSKKFIFV